jgi:hypothetical protein
MKEFCFILKDNPHITKDDVSSLFLDTDKLIELESSATMADVVTIAGIYPSKSRAKKDGWNNPIPMGWSEQEIGKLKTKIYIWNPSE